MQPRGRGSLIVASLLLAASLAALVLVGCSRNSDSASSKVRIAYVSLTCEAPIFVAHEKGFFQEEGIDVDLLKTDWDKLREGLGLGNWDAGHTLIMYLLKPILEQDLDVKITGGIHTGCLRLQVGANSGIDSIEALKGKKIGVPTHLGCPAFLFASRVLAAHGLDPSPQKSDVTWLTFQPDLLGDAVEKGRVDAIATSDPIGTMLVGMNLVRTLADQALDAPYADEYCCAVVVSGKLARERPAVAAKVTRALLKASKWIEENPTAAAKLSVEKKYISASVEMNSQALAKLRFVPGVAKCKQSIDQAARDMDKAGLLKPSTDAAGATLRAWIDLDGVTDDWLKQVRVERVAGGGRPALLPPAAFAALVRDSRSIAAGCGMN